MAFGFSPKHIRDFQVEESSKKHAFAIAIEAAKRLGWDIGFLSESGFIAYTKFSWSSWSEEVQFKINSDIIHIKSECTGAQIMDWGKNRKNVERFIQTYKAIAEEYTYQELDSMFVELEKSFVPNDEDIINQPPLSGKEQVTGLLSIFQAREGYFVTPCLLGLNLILFIFMVALGVDFMLPDVESLLQWGANYKPATLENEWWRLISSCFIHIGVIHLLMNMYALVYIGFFLEPYLDKTRFFWAYILSGIAGSISSLYWNELTVSAGASGAIFGMYGVFLAMLTTNLIEKPARGAILPSIVVFVGYSLLNGLQNQGVDNAAHIGGLLSGLVFGYAFYPSLVKPKRKALKAATILVLMALVCYPTYVLLTTISNDIGVYEQRMEQFASLEQRALGIYNNAQQAAGDAFLTEIKENGIANWEKSIALLEGTDTLDIPKKLQDRNLQLIEYCKLRIQCYEAIYKSIEENTEDYQPEIDELNRQIEEMITRLSQ